MLRPDEQAAKAWVQAKPTPQSHGPWETIIHEGSKERAYILMLLERLEEARARVKQVEQELTYAPIRVREARGERDGVQGKLEAAAQAWAGDNMDELDRILRSEEKA